MSSHTECMAFPLHAGEGQGEGSGRGRLRKYLLQVLSRVALLLLRHILRRALRDDAAAAVATIRAEVEDVIHRLQNVHVVFDDEHRVPEAHETLEDIEETPDVIEMKAGRRLVEDVERPSRCALEELGRELHALGLAAA